MKVGRLTTYSMVGALILMSASGSPAKADQHQGHTARTPSELVRAVREATERYKDVHVAEADGYHLMFGCVSGGDSGAMGLHYVKGEFLDDVLDPSRPEIVIYEPTPSGRLKLIGADFLIFTEAWHAKNPDSVPQLGGQLLHLFESPNRFGLPAFYTLHVWAWKDNPTGMFVNWHQKVSCENFNPKP
jgi:hypothetical protein